MRILILLFSSLLALVGLPPAKAQAPKQQAARTATDWSRSVAVQPNGAVAVGDPAAPVKLVEWLSYTCSHCADFAEQSKVELRDLVRRGRVQVEYRATPRDALDLTAGLLVRCGGTGRFVGSHDAVMAGQKAMLTKAEAFAGTPVAVKPVATVGERLNQLADASGLRALMRTRGLTDAQTTACLNDEAAHRRLIALSEAAQVAQIPGTPAFEVGGRRIDAHGWAELKPQLVAAPR